MGSFDHITGNQEYSSRTLGATWGIISAVMVPIVVILICVGWRILKRRKEEEQDEMDFVPIKTRSIDPEESLKMTSDDDSIPYKKDTSDDVPEVDNVKVVDAANDNNSYPYQYQDSEPPAQYPQPQQFQQPQSSRQWAGETEIN